MKYHFKVHKEGKYFWAQCIELEGCFTQGDSMEELHKNMEEALNLYVYEPANSKELAALPDDSIKTSKYVVEVALEPEIAFSFMVRYHRIQNKLTQQQAAKKLGFKNVYSYQRLEKKCNATLDMIAKVKELFPSFSIDRAFA